MKQIRNYFLYLCALGISIFALFFIITCTWIGYEIKSVCREAKNTYGSELNCSQALAKTLNDDKQSFKNKNDAIWAMGEIGNPDSLPVLKKYYTGIIPAREPLYRTISQYELKKAINLVNGGINISAFIWKSMDIEE